MLLEELDTPAVLVDLDVLDQNLQKTAELAKKANVKLRPHIKTHKSTWIVKQQQKYGISGITVATLGEAEVMASAGVEDILIAYPILGKLKLERLAKLLDQTRVTVSIDNLTVAKGLSDLGEHIGKVIPIYVDVNTGLNRCGLEPGEETASLVIEMARLPGIHVTGLMTHAGHAYREKNRDALRAVARHEAESLFSTKQLLTKKGIDIKEISVGSTPTSKYVTDATGATEIRPGAYVFGDGGQMAIGIIGEADCALTVLTTVVSTPRKGTIIVDAGSKTFSSDVNMHVSGFGTLCGNHDIYIERFSEEHGNVRVPEDAEFKVGDRLRFIPNHCCATVNLHDTLIGIREGQVERDISVDARGRVR